MRSFIVGAALAAAAAFGGAAYWLSAEPSREAQRPLTIPDLSSKAVAGETLFAGNCAGCHGENAAGRQSGPPLIHKIYEPGHHADAAFHLAVARGVRAHHWTFGNMPPVDGLDEDDVNQIVTYVREVQRANGIN